ncbi:MAG: hypothetical protein R3C71_13515 [Candidatus Krumholzibacteriia bacterium]|nr:hypothetical protein [bacterium]MCB9516514.1 hypothetical protein [Candidatus Latescibacterota bacterium]
MGRNTSMVLWGLALLAIFAGTTLLFTLLWMPVWLSPFAWTLRRTAAAGFVLALIPLTYGRQRQGEDATVGRLSRFLLRRRAWPTVGLGAILLTALLTGVQLLLIKRNPNLSISQYWREEIWAVWLAMLPASALTLTGFAGWVRLRGISRSPASRPPGR